MLYLNYISMNLRKKKLKNDFRHCLYNALVGSAEDYPTGWPQSVLCQNNSSWYLLVSTGRVLCAIYHITCFPFIISLCLHQPYEVRTSNHSHRTYWQVRVCENKWFAKSHRQKLTVYVSPEAMVFGYKLSRGLHHHHAGTPHAWLPFQDSSSVIQSF